MRAGGAWFLNSPLLLGRPTFPSFPGVGPRPGNLGVTPVAATPEDLPPLQMVLQPTLWKGKIITPLPGLPVCQVLYI